MAVGYPCQVLVLQTNDSFADLGLDWNSCDGGPHESRTVWGRGPGFPKQPQQEGSACRSWSTETTASAVVDGEGRGLKRCPADLIFYCP